MIEHQHDCKGNHRIVVDGNAGQPTLYDSPAFAKVDGKLYVAITNYYEGNLPRGVHQITPLVGEENPDAQAYNFFSEPDEPCPHIARDGIAVEDICEVCPQR